MTRYAVLLVAWVMWSVSLQPSRLAGVVVDETGAPVGRALLALTSPDLPGPRTVISGDDGRFVFPDLPAGRFRLLARKESYRTSEFGQREEGDVPTRIRLTGGQQLLDLQVKLPRLSSIRGRFVDAAGRVIPVHRWERSEGPEIRRRQAGALTPERFGLYLDGRGGFYAQRLTAGTYALRASRQSPMIDVVLRDGEHMTDVSLPMLATDAVDITASITGLVLDAQGKPMDGVQFRLVSLETEPAEDSHFSDSPEPDEQGRFTMEGIPVGRYLLLAKTAIFSGSGQASTFRSYWASTEVVVTASGAYAPLSLRAGVVVSGRVEFLGSTLVAPSLPSVSVSLIPQDGRAALSADLPGNVPGGQVSADGAFSIWSVPPGRYTLSVVAYAGQRNLGEGWAIESAMLNSVDVQDVLLTVGAEDVSGIHVRMADQSGTLEGTVRDDAGEPIVDSTVIVFPIATAAWRSGATKIRAVKPDTSGVFEVIGLSPGEYFVAAVRTIAPSSWFDPKVLGQLRESASRVTIGERGERKTVVLRVR